MAQVRSAGCCCVLNHSSPSSIDYPHSKFAAVLIILFEGASGELEVLLTTRATSMRTHGGQTALPGGKADDGEDSPTETAVCLFPRSVRWAVAADLNL